MKKFLSLTVIAFVLFNSSFATITDTTTVTKLDIISAKIFYINGEGYIKEDGKLKKVEGVKFFSINGNKYAKINGELIKMPNNVIKKINGITYVSTDGKIYTLEKFLKLHPEIEHPEIKEKEIKKEIKKIIPKELEFSDLFHAKKIDNPELNPIKTSTLEKIKEDTLMEVLSMIYEKDPNSENGIISYLLNPKHQTEENFRKLKDFYFKKKEYEIAKKFFILENIKKIDLEKLNKVIELKKSGKDIKFTNQKTNLDEILKSLGIEEKNPNSNEEVNTEEEINDIFKLLDVNESDNNIENTSTGTNANIDNKENQYLNNSPTEDNSTSNTTYSDDNINESNNSTEESSSDDDADELLNSLFGDL